MIVLLPFGVALAVFLGSPSPLRSDLTLPPDAAIPLDPAPLLQAFAQHQWKLVALLLASLTIGLFVRLLKDDTWFPTIPKKWRPIAAGVLGIFAGILAHRLGGVGWEEAIGGGIVAAYAAIFGHVSLIEGLRSGAEIPMPAWLRKTPDSSRVPSSPPTPPKDT